MTQAIPAIPLAQARPVSQIEIKITVSDLSGNVTDELRVRVDSDRAKVAFQEAMIAVTDSAHRMN